LSPRPNIDHIRRPQLIAAAAEVISERGLAATRISDVAERAGTSSAAVLYWFDSKDELLAAALSWEEDRFYSEVTERAAEGLSPGRRLAMFIEASAAGGEWTLWMEFWSRALRDPEAARTRERLDRRWRAAIAEIVREGALAGEFAPDAEPADVAATLAALLDGLAVQISLGDAEMPAERMVSLARAVAEEQLGCELPAAPELEAAVA
jgi:TetR/AcrR family transcriptional repressor of bet genes